MVSPKIETNRNSRILFLFTDRDKNNSINYFSRFYQPEAESFVFFSVCSICLSFSFFLYQMSYLQMLDIILICFAQDYTLFEGVFSANNLLASLSFQSVRQVLLQLLDPLVRFLPATLLDLISVTGSHECVLHRFVTRSFYSLCLEASSVRRPYYNAAFAFHLTCTFI